MVTIKSLRRTISKEHGINYYFCSSKQSTESTLSRVKPNRVDGGIITRHTTTLRLRQNSLKFIRLLRVVFSSQQRVTEGVIATQSNRMKFRLTSKYIVLHLLLFALVTVF